MISLHSSLFDKQFAVKNTMIKPDTPREKALLIDALKAMANALGGMLGPDTEVIVHDLSCLDHSIVAIANGHVSGRTVGDAIFAGLRGDIGLKQLTEGIHTDELTTLVDGYQTHTPDGRELNSLSLLYRDSSGQAFASLCINADHTRLRQVRDAIDAMLQPEVSQPAAETPIASVEDMAHRIIDESIAQVGGDDAKPLSRKMRVSAVKAMNARGLFLVRSSVDIAANRLGVTRHTIYNDIDK